jgi:hypothetical protein
MTPVHFESGEPQSGKNNPERWQFLLGHHFYMSPSKLPHQTQHWFFISNRQEIQILTKPSLTPNLSAQMTKLDTTDFDRRQKSSAW